MDLVTMFIGVVLLGVGIASSKAVIRGCTIVIGAIMLSLSAATVAVHLRETTFYSQHVHWMNELTRHLREVADAGDCEALIAKVQLFSDRTQDQVVDPQVLEQAMHELLEVGDFAQSTDS